MRIFIYFLIGCAVLFFSRNYIRGVLQEWVKRVKNKGPKDKPVELTALFSPSGTIRTFYVAIQIEETGTGQVEITIAKPKRGDIIEK